MDEAGRRLFPPCDLLGYPPPPALVAPQFIQHYSALLMLLFEAVN
jgi:hypothetical protein